VIVPALRAWYELESGHLLRARARADRAYADAELLGLRPHLATLDALLVAARCRIGAGELADAGEWLEPAAADAEQLKWPLPRLRAGLVAAELALLGDGPRAAVTVLEELRAALDSMDGDELDGWLAATEAVAWVGCGDRRRAQACLERLGDAPRARLLGARLALTGGSVEPVADLLGGRDRWPTSDRLEAEVLLAAAEDAGDGDRRLASALAEGRDSGWVSPFLGLGDEVAERLARLPVAELHPALASVLDPPLDLRQPAQMVEPLTPRRPCPCGAPRWP
jgi:hypothetical protein